MISGCRGLVALVLMAPPPPTLAPGDPHAPDPAPIEGPAKPESEPGIEFARPASEEPNADPLAAGSETSASLESSDAPEPYEPAASWPTPGAAPGDGMGGITTGAILIGSAALMTLALYNQPANGPQDRAAILGVGIGMGVLGAGMIGMGLYRHAKLRRWTLAYRVRAYPQGGGLLAAGTIALTFGVGLTASGVFALTRDSPGAPAILLPIGAVSLAAIAPTTIVFGKRRRDRYLRTGGWYRPELPPVPEPTVRVAPWWGPSGAGANLRLDF